MDIPLRLIGTARSADFARTAAEQERSFFFSLLDQLPIGIVAGQQSREQRRTLVHALTALVLPVVGAAADRSARRIRDGLRARLGVEIAVIVSDTFGRTWRRGLTDVAIGCAGIAAVVDLRGTEDALGRELHVTEVAVVDELAGAAELVMG